MRGLAADQAAVLAAVLTAVLAANLAAVQAAVQAAALAANLAAVLDANLAANLLSSTLVIAIEHADAEFGAHAVSEANISANDQLPGWNGLGEWSMQGLRRWKVSK